MFLDLTPYQQNDRLTPMNPQDNKTFMLQDQHIFASSPLRFLSLRASISAYKRILYTPVGLDDSVSTETHQINIETDNLWVKRQDDEQMDLGIGSGVLRIE
jgi:hypothetical protein